MPFTGGEIRNLDSVIKERHLDTSEIDAETFTVNDVADYFTATTIEAVIAEIHGNTKYLTNGVFEDNGYTDNLNGTITLNTLTATLAATNRELRETHTIIGGITGTDFPAITQGEVNYVVIKYNSGSPIFDVLSGAQLALIDEIEYIPYITVVRENTELDIVEWSEMGDNLVNKLHARLVKTARFVRESGFVLSEDTGRIVKVSGGTLWNGANKLLFNDYTSNTDDLELWYHSGGSWTKSVITQYNNTQWDNGVNLQTLTDGKYAINWVYKSAGQPKKVRIVLGGGDYTVGEAKASTVPIGLPDIFTKVSLLVGRIIVKKNDTTAQIIDNPFVIYSFSPFAPHGELQGLNEDDHVQYILHDGTRAMTGNLSLGDQDITNVKKLSLTGTLPTIEFINGGLGTIKHDGNLVIKADNNNLWLDAELEIDAWKILDMNNFNIKNLPYPTQNSHPITLEYIYEGYDFKKDPTGFTDAENKVHIYITGTTFYIEPKITSYKYLQVGRLHTVTSTQSVSLSSFVKGDLIYIYYNPNNVLTATTTPWSFGLGQVFIATSYVYEETGSPGVKKYTLNNELHGARMADATHDYLHNSVGTRYVSGLGATFIANNTYNLSDGIIYDEDLPTNITGATPFVSGYVAWRDVVLDWTRNGISGDWYKQDGSFNPYYDNNGVLTASALNKYTIWWIFAVNGYTVKIASYMGQDEYASLVDAQIASIESDMLFGTVPTVEYKLLYKVILQNKSGDNNIVSDVQDFRLNVSLPGSTPTLTSHSSLAGLLNDDHPQYLLANGSRPLSADWNVGSTMSGVDAIQFDTTYSNGTAVGKIHWDSDKGTLQLGMSGNVSLQVGQETLVKVYNGTASTISNARAVSVVSIHNENLSIDLTNSTNYQHTRTFLGITVEDIAASSYGYVCTIGLIHDVNTLSFSAGNILYVDPSNPGNFTITRPLAPNYPISIGMVIVSDASNGIIGVITRRFFDLEHQSDIFTNTSKTGKEILIWDNTNSYYDVRKLIETDISDFASYLKIDGSVSMTGNLLIANNTAISWRDIGNTKWIEGVKMDASDNLLLTHDTGKKIIAESFEITGVLTALDNIVMSGTGTFTTGTGAIALNGDITIATGKNLIFADGGSVNIINTTYVANNTSLMTSLAIATKIEAYGYSTTVGTVTAVTGTVPIVSSGGVTPDISIQVATSAQHGYLSSTDWTTFNGKVNGAGAVAAVEAAGINFATTKTLGFIDGGSINIINTTFVDNDTSLMTSQAIKEKIEAYNYVNGAGAISAVEGEATLDLTGDVSIASTKKITYTDFEIVYTVGTNSLDFNYTGV